jgi:hypothetical protein
MILIRRNKAVIRSLCDKGLEIKEAVAEVGYKKEV